MISYKSPLELQECLLRAQALLRHYNAAAPPLPGQRRYTIVTTENLFHSWVEVYLDGLWYELEAFILDKAYLSRLQSINSTCIGAFCGYGVAVKDFRKPIIDFERNNTYIQSEGINQDFGIYDCPDNLLEEHYIIKKCQHLKRFYTGI